jgi:hypothetical protein
MTIKQMLNALPVVQKIMELKLPIKKAFKVYSLAKQINEQRDFFINEEKKLIEKFQAQVSEQGVLSFSSQEEQSAFSKEYKEILNFSIENLEIVELKFEDLGDAAFSPIELSLLDGVINFID